MPWHSVFFQRIWFSEDPLGMEAQCDCPHVITEMDLGNTSIVQPCWYSCSSRTPQRGGRISHSRSFLLSWCKCVGKTKWRHLKDMGIRSRQHEEKEDEIKDGYRRRKNSHLVGCPTISHLTVLPVTAACLVFTHACRSLAQGFTIPHFSQLDTPLDTLRYSISFLSSFQVGFTCSCLLWFPRMAPICNQGHEKTVLAKTLYTVLIEPYISV